jgi:hypothetical protein
MSCPPIHSIPDSVCPERYHQVNPFGDCHLLLYGQRRCGDARCSLPCRQKWAHKQATLVRLACEEAYRDGDKVYFGDLVIEDDLTTAEHKAIRSGFLTALTKHAKDRKAIIKITVNSEIGNNLRVHYHYAMRATCVVDKDVVKSLWVNVCGDRKTSIVHEAPRSLKARSRYMFKDMKDPGEVRLWKRGSMRTTWGHRGFFVPSKATLWSNFIATLRMEENGREVEIQVAMAVAGEVREAYEEHGGSVYDPLQGDGSPVHRRVEQHWAEDRHPYGVTEVPETPQQGVSARLERVWSAAVCSHIGEPDGEQTGAFGDRKIAHRRHAVAPTIWCTESSWHTEVGCRDRCSPANRGSIVPAIVAGVSDDGVRLGLSVAVQKNNLEYYPEQDPSRSVLRCARVAMSPRQTTDGVTPGRTATMWRPPKMSPFGPACLPP